MALSKKDAKRSAAVLRKHIPSPKLQIILGALHGTVKNKSFQKSIGRIHKAAEKLDRPPKAVAKKVG